MPTFATAETQEHHCFTLQGLEVAHDVDAGVLKGVKLIGHHSKNGREYPASVLRNAVSHYEGIAINVDHAVDANGKPSQGPRSVRSRNGMAVNARYVEDKGIFADWKYNPKQSETEKILWSAENMPGEVGFSHDARLRVNPKKNDKVVVEEIVGVRSVDVVADPATTASLFEHDASHGDIPETENEEMALENVTLAELKEARPDLVTAIESAATESSELEAVIAERDALKAAAKLADEIAAIEAELIAAKLDPKDDKQCSAAFLKVLRTAEATDRAELIADRAALVGERKPTKPVTTTDTTEGVKELTADAFIAAMRR